jgi:hypothetical protein
LSKILDLITYNKKNGQDKKGKTGNFSDHAASDHFDSDTKEKLANTYIFNPIDKGDDVDKKQDGKTLHEYGAVPSKFKFAHFFPWLISFLAVLLLLINIAYRGKIIVNIELRNEPAPQVKSSVFENASLVEDLVISAGPAEIKSIATYLVTDGRLNRSIVKKLAFYGAASTKSKVMHDGLFLFNDGTTGWASAGFDFTEPIDLSNSNLDFFIKGIRGSESLKLFLRDADSNSYMPQAHHNIFKRNMAKDWQYVSISFGKFNGAYDPKKIQHIGFEFGTQTTSNESGASIFIKNLKIVKNTARGG